MAPDRDALHARSPQAIIDALTSGSMRYQGLALNGLERRAIAEYLTGRTLANGITTVITGKCGRLPPLGEISTGPSWNGWSPSLENTHYQSGEQAGLTAADLPKLTLKWAFGFPDTASAWAQPTVAGGRLFVGSQNGLVYSLDAKSGCTIWTFTAHAGVRASVTIGPVRLNASRSDDARLKPSRFDDARLKPSRSASDEYMAFVADQAGWVYALDAATGRLRWSRKVDEHPLVRLTGAPAVHGGRVYIPTSSYEEGGKPPGYACCTFRGSIVALDAGTGDVIWKTYTIPSAPTLLRAYADGTERWGPSGGAIWSAPTIDVKRGAIYVGVGNTYSGAPQRTADAIVAFDLRNGSIRWATQMNPGERDVFGCAPGDVNCGDKPGPDFDFGASPVLAHVANGRDLIVAGQKSGIVYALDPDRKGRVVWRYRAGAGSGLGGIQWGVAADAALAYVPVADIYAEPPGGLHAVALANGTRRWFAAPQPPVCGKPSRACSSAQFSAITAVPGAVLSPSNDGAVRAYSTSDGSVIWIFDTNRQFDTLNGVKARGGSMNGPAPVVVGGFVYVSSGYGAFGLRPGNVLLAFGR